MKKYLNLKNFILAGIISITSCLFFCQKESYMQKNNNTYSTTPGSTDTGSVTPFPVAQVTILHSAFSPPTVTTAKGSGVSWTNQDTQVHTVTSASGLFDSGDLAFGKNYVTSFPNTGTYIYFCRYHKESGKITIE